jgi:hypothetical protein
MRYTVKPSDIYPSEKDISIVLTTNNLKIIGFHYPKKGQLFIMTNGKTVWSTYAIEDLKGTPRFIVEPRNAAYDDWWE